MIQNVFTEIYKNKSWGRNEESVSGAGSSLDYTNELRKELINLFDKLQIKKIFDAPCGDFNWMKEVVNSVSIDYEGGDIVNDLIDNNNKLYKNSNIRFLNFDITDREFPDADLWLCRDCFIHLSYQDILSSLKKFSNSNIKYLLTTTHINQDQFKNQDIDTGGFRYIDLFSFPFEFSKNPIKKINDWKPPYKPAELVLFTKDQIVAAINNFERNIKK